MGDWSGQASAATEAALLAGETPPGGESNAAFTARIATALQGLTPLLAQAPLQVGSKGVARVLGELCGHTGRLTLDNSALLHFDLSACLVQCFALCGT